NTARGMPIASSTVAGGGIYLKGGTLSLDASQVLSNIVNLSSTVSANAFGGGIYANGLLTASNSTIQNNLAFIQGGGGGAGGGLYVVGDTRLLSDTVANNRIQHVGFPVSGSGGGIVSSARLWLTDTLLSANSAQYGGALQFSFGRVWLSRSTLRFNSAYQ